MTWVLVHDGAIRTRGSYADVLDAAGEWRVLQRAFHFDGTEFAPRLNRGWMIVPEAMIPARRRRAAA